MRFWVRKTWRRMVWTRAAARTRVRDTLSHTNRFLSCRYCSRAVVSCSVLVWYCRLSDSLTWINSWHSKCADSVSRIKAAFSAATASSSLCLSSSCLSMTFHSFSILIIFSVLTLIISPMTRYSSFIFTACCSYSLNLTAISAFAISFFRSSSRSRWLVSTCRLSSWWS